MSSSFSRRLSALRSHLTPAPAASASEGLLWPQGEGQPQGRIGVELASGAERVHWSEVTPYIGHESSIIWPVGRMLGEDGAPSPGPALPSSTPDGLSLTGCGGRWWAQG